jgi:hypothetical protein
MVVDNKLGQVVLGVLVLRQVVIQTILFLEMPVSQIHRMGPVLEVCLSMQQQVLQPSLKHIMEASILQLQQTMDIKQLPVDILVILDSILRILE